MSRQPDAPPIWIRSRRCGDPGAPPMRIRRNFALSRKALLRHGVRTALAVSGTTIGVAAVLVMVAIGEGAEAELMEQVEALGGNLLIVTAAQAEPLVGRPGGGGLVTTLTPTDAQAILGAAPGVERVSASIDGRRDVKYGRLALATSVRAVTPEYEEIRNFRTSSGRYFTAEEDRLGRRVTVIGTRVANTLFGGDDPIGEIVRIGRIPLEVVGVLESKGTSTDGGRDEDNQILIPLQTGLRRVFNSDFVTLVYVQVRDDASMEDAQTQIASLLRERHRLDRLGRPDDFRIDNQRLVLEAEEETAASFQRLITTLAGVALLVGGVGILSIMLLSIRERRNEIGLRIAVGGKRRDVRTQFVVEALLLGAGGAVTGLLVGLAAAGAIGRMTEWRTEVSGPALAIAIGSALLVSLIFGVYPAQRAASLDPIQSLQAE